MVLHGIAWNCMVLQRKVALMQQKGGQLDMVGLVAGWGVQLSKQFYLARLPSVSIFWQFCCVARVYHIYRVL